MTETTEQRRARVTGQTVDHIKSLRWQLLKAEPKQIRTLGDGWAVALLEWHDPSGSYSHLPDAEAKKVLRTALAA